MKRLLLIAVLLATPALAQTGDCTAETGTTTAWEIIGGGTGQGFVEIRWTFYAAGLTGELQTERSSGLGSGDDATVFANSQCSALDESREADEWDEASRQVNFFEGANGGLPESVQPAYPELCATVFPSPSNFGGTAAQDCRKARFHQQLMREVWPEDALRVFADFYELWDWLQSNNAQGGAAFNTNEVQSWLGNPVDFPTLVNPRMNNLDAIASGIAGDQQWQGELQQGAQ